MAETIQKTEKLGQTVGEISVVSEIDFCDAGLEMAESQATRLFGRRG